MTTHIGHRVNLRDPHIHTDETFKFEQTGHLVTAGIYRYIRHPLYSALLLLAWPLFALFLLTFLVLAQGTKTRRDDINEMLLMVPLVIYGLPLFLATTIALF